MAMHGNRAQGMSPSPNFHCTLQPQLTTPQIDVAKLASLTGYTAGSASVTLGKIKRKLKDHAGQFSASNPATPKKSNTGAGVPKTPKSTGKRGAKGAANDESPTKKQNTGKKGKGKRAGADDDDDEEEFKVANIKKEEQTELLNGANDFFAQEMPDFGN